MEARNSAAIFLAATLMMAGCTVTPAPVESKTAPFSGNVANGGVIDLGPDNKGPAHVTPQWVADYHALAKIYGDDLLRPIRGNEGLVELPDGTYQVDFEHLADKNFMASLKRSAIPP